MGKQIKKIRLSQRSYYNAVPTFLRHFVYLNFTRRCGGFVSFLVDLPISITIENFGQVEHEKNLKFIYVFLCTFQREITKCLSIPLLQFTRPEAIVPEQLIHIPLVRLSTSEFRCLSLGSLPPHHSLALRTTGWKTSSSTPCFCPWGHFVIIYYYFIYLYTFFSYVLPVFRRRPLSQKRLINLTDACCTSHCLQMLAGESVMSVVSRVVVTTIHTWYRVRLIQYMCAYVLQQSSQNYNLFDACSDIATTGSRATWRHGRVLRILLLILRCVFVYEGFIPLN